MIQIATLYELQQDYLTLLEMMDDENIDPQAITDTMEAVEGELEIKAENYAKIMKNISGDIEKLKAEEKRIANRRKSLEHNVDVMKQKLFETMKTTGKEKFKTPLFSFSIAKNGGKLPIVIDVDCSSLPDDLVVVDRKPNLDLIRSMLETEGENQLAHFGERKESLRIR